MCVSSCLPVPCLTLERMRAQVCELDLIFNFQKAYAVLDELIIAGEIQESSKKTVLKIVRLYLIFLL